MRSVDSSLFITQNVHKHTEDKELRVAHHKAHPDASVHTNCSPSPEVVQALHEGGKGELRVQMFPGPKMKWCYHENQPSFYGLMSEAKNEDQARPRNKHRQSIQWTPISREKSR